MKQFLLLACLLGGTAFAGGAGPRVPAGDLTRHAALAAVPGVRVVEAPPFEGQSNLTEEQLDAQSDYFLRVQSIYAVTVRVGNRLERVLVSPSAVEGSAKINALAVFVPTTRASAAQREALVRVALGFFNICAPAQAQSLGAPFWQARLRQPWEQATGWQEGQSGKLKVGWSGKEGLYPLGDEKTERAGLNIEWPADTGRCTF